MLVLERERTLVLPPLTLDQHEVRARLEGALDLRVPVVAEVVVARDLRGARGALLRRIDAALSKNEHAVVARCREEQLHTRALLEIETEDAVRARLQLFASRARRH